MFYYEDVLSGDSYQSPPLGQADALRYATNVGYGYTHGADQRINVRLFTTLSVRLSVRKKLDISSTAKPIGP